MVTIEPDGTMIVSAWAPKGKPMASAAANATAENANPHPLPLPNCAWQPNQLPEGWIKFFILLFFVFVFFVIGFGSLGFVFPDDLDFDPVKPETLDFISARISVSRKLVICQTRSYDLTGCI